MKKFYFIFVLVVLSVGVARAEDNIPYSMSTLTIDSITYHYNAILNLNNSSHRQSDSMNCEYKLDFIMQHKNKIIKKLIKTRGYESVSKAECIITNMYDSARELSSRISKSCEKKATAQAYFDDSTGHFYVRDKNGTYSEYNKKGQFFKTVSSDQPHLASSDRVHPISEEDYILYVKKSDGHTDHKILPCTAMHPKGWISKRLLVSVD